MVDGLPSPTPEGQLIRRVRGLTIPKLSIRNAAARIGMSAEQWGYVERGYLPSRGGKPPQPFSPPAATLARMAYTLNITPERLESEGQRPDAAEILRELLHREVEAADAPAAIPAGSLPSAPESGLLREDAVRPYATPIWERLFALAAEGVLDPDGARLGLSPEDAKVWDGSAGAMSLADRAWLVGDIRRRRIQRHSDARNRQERTG